MTLSGRHGRDDSMSLLRMLMEDTLDPGYAKAAAARAEPPHRARSTLALLAAGLALVGFLFGVAAEAARTRASAGEGLRSALLAEAHRRTAAADALAARVRSLSADIAGRRAEALRLSKDGAALAGTLAQGEERSGLAAVQGPGVAVTITDAAGAAAGSGANPRQAPGTDAGRVRDGDLQRIVNGLWQAGAEAVAVNGQRLTSVTAIRGAGDAVLVGYRPLSPPYRVEAIGDPEGLAQRFEVSATQAYLNVLEKRYGIDSRLERAAALTLPAATGVTLRSATVPKSASAGDGEDAG